MIGIRQKLMLGFGGSLAILIAVGLVVMAQLYQLGGAIDVILRENYRSVLACQEMKETLERIDSGLLFTLSGAHAEGVRMIRENRPKFGAALDDELDNVTLPGEGERAGQIKTLFGRYSASLAGMQREDRALDERRLEYYSTLRTLFSQIEDAAQGILLLNQRNMYEANESARRLAAAARHRMLAAIACAAGLALLFSSLAHRWIIHPITRLTESAVEIQRGNLELVLKKGARDEIGRLSEAFNEMTAALRQARQADARTLQRTRRATEEVFAALPDMIAVINPDGRVEVATETASRLLGLRIGVVAGDLGFDWLSSLIHHVLSSGMPVSGGSFQRFVDNEERFFQPVAVPITGGRGNQEVTGLAVIVKDVTQLREQQELKRSVVSTVSHQLRSPLTSVRMAIHLLLEERVGALTGKQAELLVAAREDSERLANILADLLDLNRIESGRSPVSLEPAQPQAMVREAVESYHVEAKDRNIELSADVSDDLPEVGADRAKIGQVFANLLSNALRFTNAGGSITVRARPDKNGVMFSVTDTGTGIPDEFIARLFVPFSRAPGQDDRTGTGLGLAIVKEIVAAHGGEVGVESEIGRGSVFHFTLPVWTARDDKA